MNNFTFSGNFFRVRFDFTTTEDYEVVFEFGDIRLQSDFYYWFVNLTQMEDTPLAEKLRRLNESDKPGEAFAIMLQELFDSWLDVLRASSGNLLAGFFDEGCQIIQTGSQENSTVHLDYYWTSEILGYFDHPIDLQKKYGGRRDIELLDMDQPTEETKRNMWIADIEQASSELKSWANTHAD
jgi:hypothetical protein